MALAHRTTLLNMLHPHHHSYQDQYISPMAHPTQSRLKTPTTDIHCEQFQHTIWPNPKM
jgi:hypothetical protein